MCNKSDISFTRSYDIIMRSAWYIYEMSRFMWVLFWVQILRNSQYSINIDQYHCNYQVFTPISSSVLNAFALFIMLIFVTDYVFIVWWKKSIWHWPFLEIVTHPSILIFREIIYLYFTGVSQMTAYSSIPTNARRNDINRLLPKSCYSCQGTNVINVTSSCWGRVDEDDTRFVKLEQCMGQCSVSEIKQSVQKRLTNQRKLILLTPLRPLLNVLTRLIFISKFNQIICECLKV